MAHLSEEHVLIETHKVSDEIYKGKLFPRLFVIDRGRGRYHLGGK